MMTPESTLASVISVFGLALAVDSGFYEVDMLQSEEFYWGKNAGCNFVAQFCDGKNFIMFTVELSTFIN